MLQCGPSLRTFVHLAAFWLAKVRTADKDEVARAAMALVAGGLR